MNNRDLARQFAAGATRGTGSHMFIEGDAIYSYGHHFPIARRQPFGYTFNPAGYSNTTAKHKSFVRGALSGEILEVPMADIGRAREQHERNEREMQTATQKYARARKRREMWENQIMSLKSHNERLKRFII